MTAPDFIWSWTWDYPIDRCHGKREWVGYEPKPMTLQVPDGFWGNKTRYIPQEFTAYVRRDPAVIAALPEVQALIAAKLEEAAAKMDCGCSKDRSDCLCKSGNVAFCYRDGLLDLDDLITPDMAQAIAERDALVRREERERCARIVDAMQDEWAAATYKNPGDRMQHASKVYASGEIAAAIRADGGK